MFEFVPVIIWVPLILCLDKIKGISSDTAKKYLNTQEHRGVILNIDETNFKEKVLTISNIFNLVTDQYF